MARRRLCKMAVVHGLVLSGLIAAVAQVGCSTSTPGEILASADRPVMPPEVVPSGPTGIVFTDVAAAAGIDFTESFGDAHFSNLVEATGGGVAFLDYDQDGWLDVYLTTGKYVKGLSDGEEPRIRPLNRLFHNRRDGTFEDVTGAAGVGLPNSFSMGVAVGDYNNDSYPDLFVGNYGRSTLFRNNGDGTFTDVTDEAGVANAGLCSVAATWFDYDRDGRLDLYVGAYIDFDPGYDQYYSPDGFPGPLSYKGEPDHLYRNLDGKHFKDVTEEVGLAGMTGRAMSVATIDVDRDGFPDLYVTNDGTENFLLHNESGRHFSQIARDLGVGYNGMGDSTASMGVDFGDFDGDGNLDLFVSDNSLGSLYRNEGDGLFMDAVVESGLAMRSAQYVSWGSFFFDFDNDGDLDILEANSDLSRLFGQEDQIFQNDGTGSFQDVSGDLGPHFSRTLLSRGAAFADYDNDGDLDVMISNINGPAVLLRNDGGNRRNWLSLDLHGRTSNRDGVGAVISVQVGGQKRVAYRKSSSGYLSCSDPRVHFGLGDSKRVDSIEIVWPSGTTQVLKDVKANQILTVEEPAG
ncbi:MAG: CRTAC1 family protein [Acidobacteriota bacterium]